MSNTRANMNPAICQMLGIDGIDKSNNKNGTN
jgi:hypothetical protein